MEHIYFVAEGAKAHMISCVEFFEIINGIIVFFGELQKLDRTLVTSSIDLDILVHQNIQKISLLKTDLDHDSS